MFDDIREKVTDTLGIVQKKGEDLAHISRLRLNAVKLSSKISSEYKNLGMLVYECRMGGFDDTQTIECCVKEIAQLRRELTLLNREIDNLTGTVRCDFCLHKNQNSEQTCQKCGEPLEKSVVNIDDIKNEIAQIKQNIKDLTEN